MSKTYFAQRNKIVALAKKEYKKQEENGNNYFTPKDALTYALEELDTGYDFSHSEYELLLIQTKATCGLD